MKYDDTDELDTDVKSPVVRRMLKNWRLSADAEDKNRERGLKSLKFAQGGKDQWDQTFLDAFELDNRPHESYNQIPVITRQVTNDMRMNMAQIKFIPGKDGSKEVATAYEDLVRNIQTDGEAEVAYDTAAYFQVTIGWGYWRYITEYENNETFDQIIRTKWIPNPFTVYDDPYALEQDCSDRKFLVQVCDVDVKTFNDDYDRDYDSTILQSIGDTEPDWGNDKTVRIAEYWEVTDKKSKIYRLKPAISPDPTIYNEIPEGADKSWFDEREVSVPKVMWYKCTAEEVLEEREWPGIFIPYVKVVGDQVNIDGQWNLTGLVENLIAPQKQINYWTNAATELVALAPKAPYILEIGQVSDPAIKAIWDKSNIRAYPYLPYKGKSVDGTMLPPPQRNQNSADISSTIALVQLAQDNIYKCGGISQAGLGLKSNESSGKAIMARQREGDVSTFLYPDNMARSQRFGGRILEDLIKKIYDAARMIRGKKEDGTVKDIPINQVHMGDNGKPVEFDFTKGYYDVMVTTGPSYTTKRQESAESMIQFIQAFPPAGAVTGDLVANSMDWPNADKFAERLKKTLPPGIADEPKAGDVPPEIKQQMDQAQQMIDQLTETVHKLNDELDLKEADTADKQADAALKVEEMKINAEQAARQYELDKLDRAIKMEELGLKRQDQELKKSQLELNATTAGLNFIQKEREIDTANTVDTNQ